jgi:NAD(P)-dependent dehydrogenase (short-subunit alcohol dehydrogenase family)
VSTAPWTEANVPDLMGKRAVVTGATSGLGRETARALASKGAEVVLAVRDTDRGEKVAAELRSAQPVAEVTVRKLDLASLASIQAFADELLGEVERLDILANNAGVMVPPLGYTEDGFELQMGTNHFGTYALTGRLMGLLSKTPGARITVTSSVAHRRGNPDLTDLDWGSRRYNAWRAYGDSKIANLLFAFELNRRLGGTGPTVCASHPGWTRTDLQRHSGMANLLNPIVAMPVEKGVLAPLRAATDPDARSADFFGPDGRGEMRGYPVRVEPVERAKDPELARRLWEISAERTGVAF